MIVYLCNHLNFVLFIGRNNLTEDLVVGNKKHDLLMSFDEFMIIVRDFVSNGNKSLLGHLEQGLVRSQELISNFQKNSDLCRCREHSLYSGRIHVTFNLVEVFSPFPFHP